MLGGDSGCVGALCSGPWHVEGVELGKFTSESKVEKQIFDKISLMRKYFGKVGAWSAGVRRMRNGNCS